ncbi:hypothetical protein KEJ18_02590 [Candidatus Bathyarchaeota archaeon]|nr:hypothetical protein [Candidatus Bathyarchaeota archaeon]
MSIRQYFNSGIHEFVLPFRGDKNDWVIVLDKERKYLLL